MIPGEQRVKVGEAALFGKVAVMLGGYSSEREVSLLTGRAVHEALLARGIDAELWDLAERDLAEFAGAGFDRVWIALHGPGGEDGALQGALQWLDVPYTGSGVMASALAMDKIRTKQLLRATGIHTPEFRVIRNQQEAAAAAVDLGLPIVLKPNSEGSSVAISKVYKFEELAAAADLALERDGFALAERCIEGDELTVAVLQGQSLPSIRIETPHVFYDYRAKYEVDTTRYICPGTTSATDEAHYAELACTAFSVLGCSGWGRVDFMTGEDGDPQVLEVNTIPGMTSHSLVPMAAREAGIDFAELCWRILETSMVQKSLRPATEAAANDA